MPFSEYGLGSYISKFYQDINKKVINSTILENISSNLWKEDWKNIFMEKVKKLPIKKKIHSIHIKPDLKSGSFNGIKYDLKKSIVNIKLNNKESMTMPFEINPKSEYEMQCFSPQNEKLEKYPTKRIY